MAETDDDEVVQELDVYISKALADKLYLCQYPLRPAHMTYDDGYCLEARVKPKQQKVEIEFSLNTSGPNYDKSKGEAIAQNADGHSEKDTYFNGAMMDKQVLTSTRAVASADNYAVGLLRPGELHLTPLHAIVQMKPSFAYMDRSDTDSGAVDTFADGAEEEEDEPKAVTMRFASTETDRLKKARERSYKFIQQQMANEPWTNVKFHNFGSEMSGVERTMLLCPQMDQDMSDLPGTPQDYLKSLVVENESTTSGSSSSSASKMASCGQSMQALQKLPLPDQIKSIMMSAKVINFAKLLSLMPKAVDETSIVRSLQQVAVLVQGCWVVKSEVLYPKDSFSPQTGVSADILCRSRDYVMWLYTQSRHIVQQKLVDTIRLPPEDVKMMLSSMGRLTPQGWEFLLPYDKNFVSRHSDVVQRQQMLWDAKQQYLSKSFKAARQEAKGRNDAIMQSPPAGGRPRQRRRTRSRQDSMTSEGSGSESGTDRMDAECSKPRRGPASPSSKGKADGEVSKAKVSRGQTNADATRVSSAVK
ncbi:DNA-directed RNA polymerase III subunit RPC5-like isoform X2 [Ornithodoros turicata]|uniref:DNA-directed RNA polymerase III subunit RPC5-like isoform X2 n=1 Tax=Ornithodoros turicata TaxID=34597 RepID=UPI0031388502